MLRLVLPTMAYKEQVMAYKKEFIKNHDVLAGCGGLACDVTYEQWMKSCYDNLDEETVQKGYVTATTFLAVTNTDELVGMIQIRHALNEHLLRVGGHIGYSVKIEKRRQGVATNMIKLALKECERLNIKKVLITCDIENVGSAKTIETCGGVLENIIKGETRSSKRYWVTISE